MMPLFFATAIPNSIPASLHGLVPAGLLMLLDAAARALLVACVVGAGLRIMAGRHVPAQKTAWGLVLLGALLMPVLAPWAGKATWLPSGATFVLPAHAWSQSILSRGGAFRSEQAPPDISAAPPEVASAPRATASLSTAVSMPLASASVDRVDISSLSSASADRFPAPTISSAQTAGTDGLRAQPSLHTFYLPLSDLLWLIYGSVSLALLLRLAYGLGGAIGLWQSAEPVHLDSHLAEGLRLRSSRKISSPVTVGSGVVLPAGYDEWDIQKLRIVLAHERSHVRQGDFYFQALAGLYTAMFWFSPLGWWLRRKLSDLSEATSDQAGLEEAPSRASYARMLLEFAAMPRRTQVGVAMARSGRISQRIERLLDENNFSMTFSGGRRRIGAALVLVPLTLFAAAALIRVEAAQTLQQPGTEQGPVIAQSRPASAPEPAPAPTPAAPAVAPASPTAPDDVRTVQAPASPAVPAPAAASLAQPAPPDASDEEDADQGVATTVQCNGHSTSIVSNRSSTHTSSRHGYSYAYSSSGDSYALVSAGDKNHMSFSGDWYDGRRAELDKARTMVHGDFLWFTRDGKSYVVDDPQTIARVQAMYKPMEELGRRQEELGRQQAALGRRQAEFGHRQSQASIPTPDISREMAELNAAISRLQAGKSATITMDQLADVQGKIGELQGKLGGLQGQIGARQGEFGRQQGLLGDQQGKLGEQQGRLGEEQSRLAGEADTKIKSIIDESLKDGKARPVQ